MKMTNSQVIEVKVVILGLSSSGKSCLLNRYTRDIFYEGSMQSDTAGSERFESMARMYYRDAKAAIVCYDVTCLKSYNRAVKWVNELKETCEDCFIYICGTKVDLVHGAKKTYRQIDVHDVIEFADSIGAKMFETSSKTGEGVVELFTAIARDLSNTRSVLDLVPSIRLHKSPQKHLKKCTCIM